jgi:flavin reductase (DIM6/NTAB) family NADH-FMN oxidoreductase RutF
MRIKTPVPGKSGLGMGKIGDLGELGIRRLRNLKNLSFLDRSRMSFRGGTAMEIDPETKSPPEIYHLLTSVITPRPIAWVSTLSPRGIPNLAPFSFFCGVGSHPPALAFSPVNRRDGSKKDTVRNIEAMGEFVVNTVPFRLAGAMNATSADLAYEESEFAHAGLTPVTSSAVLPPGVAEAPVRMECRLLQIVPVGEGPLAANLVIGRIVRFHVSESVLSGDRIDAAKLDAIGRMGGDVYARTTAIFQLPRPTFPPAR